MCLRLLHWMQWDVSRPQQPVWYVEKPLGILTFSNRNMSWDFNSAAWTPSVRGTQLKPPVFQKKSRRKWDKERTNEREDLTSCILNPPRNLDEAPHLPTCLITLDCSQLHNYHSHIIHLQMQSPNRSGHCGQGLTLGEVVAGAPLPAGE